MLQRLEFCNKTECMNAGKAISVSRNSCYYLNRILCT